MPDAPQCQAGHVPVVGRPFLVKVGPHEKVPMCEFHGRTFQYGEAIVKLLGRDHAVVVPLIVALSAAMDAGCPAGGVIPLPGTGAEEDSESLLRRDSVTLCAGSPDGVAAT